jgi:hypothetical protein
LTEENGHGKKIIVTPILGRSLKILKNAKSAATGLQMENVIAEEWDDERKTTK